MKKNYLLLVSSIALILAYSCNKDDDPIDPGTSTTDLLAKKVSTGPILDGTIDDAWSACQTLTGTAAVPSNADFEFYVGEAYDFTMRAMYDDNNIYFLAEWVDAADSKDRESWYFDTDDNVWDQQNKFPESVADKYYEDKFAFMWPVDLGADWDASTCYSICHAVDAGLGYDKGTKHYTNAAGEVVDMWHWKRVRTGNPGVNHRRGCNRNRPCPRSCLERCAVHPRGTG